MSARALTAVCSNDRSVSSENIHATYSEGQEVDVRILEVNTANNKMSLSMLPVTDEAGELAYEMVYKNSLELKERHLVHMIALLSCRGADAECSCFCLGLSFVQACSCSPGGVALKTFRTRGERVFLVCRNPPAHLSMARRRLFLDMHVLGSFPVAHGNYPCIG